MLRKSRWIVAAFFAMAIGAGLASMYAADEPPANPPRRGQGGGQGGIFQNEKVQKALDLTDDQKEQIKKVVDDMRSGAASLRDLPQEERRAKMQARTKELFEKVSGVLNDKQKERLKQIRVQVAGVAGLLDGETADALKLTDDQKAKIKDAIESRRKDLREMFQAAAGGSREEARDKMTKFLKDSEGKLLDILTSEQKETFTKLQGEKLDLGTAGGGFFGGQGFGGGRGRRGQGDNSAPAKPDTKSADKSADSK
jgi:Spy/CpxP family protein refolding chaperone